MIATRSTCVTRDVLPHMVERGSVVSPGPVETEMWERLENDHRPFAAVSLNRFKRLGFLPKLSPEQIADATIDAVLQEQRFVRLPQRYGAYHLLSNAPRRLVEVVLLGTKFRHDWKKTKD